MKYLITGSPGSGKSTISKLLREKGYRVIDVDDEPGLADWVDKETGQITKSNHGNNAEWYKKHDWNWNRDKLNALLNTASNIPIFICGITSNQSNDLDLFDKIFLLQAKEELLRHRMRTRDEKDAYGKTDTEVDHVFTWHTVFEDEMIKHGAIVINASKPLEEVLTQIQSNM